MKKLIVDFYNQYAKFSFSKKTQRSLFFKSIVALQEKYNCNEVYYVFDGSELHKKTIDPFYKSNRNLVVESRRILEVQDIIKNLSKSYLVKNVKLEADDMSYYICKTYEGCVCVSEDRDWLYNLTANLNTYIYQDKKLLHSFNFEQEKGFPINKIPLYLFLSGDSKDGVYKPFKIKGSVLSNVKEYDSIIDYCVKNDITKDQIKTYLQLIFPIDYIPFNVLVGHNTDRTPILLKENRLTFLGKTKQQKANLNAALCD